MKELMWILRCLRGEEGFLAHDCVVRRRGGEGGNEINDGDLIHLFAHSGPAILPPLLGAQKKRTLDAMRTSLRSGTCKLCRR